MRQTVGALFWSLEPNYQLWSTRADSQAIPILSPGEEVTLEPLRINRKRLLGMFTSGGPSWSRCSSKFFPRR